MDWWFQIRTGQECIKAKAKAKNISTSTTTPVNYIVDVTKTICHGKCWEKLIFNKFLYRFRPFDALVYINARWGAVMGIGQFAKPTIQLRRQMRNSRTRVDNLQLGRLPVTVRHQHDRRAQKVHSRRYEHLTRGDFWQRHGRPKIAVSLISSLRTYFSREEDMEAFLFAQSL